MLFGWVDFVLLGFVGLLLLLVGLFGLIVFAWFCMILTLCVLLL